MGPLTTLAITVAVVTGCGAAAPVRAETVASWHPHIAEASLRFGIPKAWIERVMRAESGGRTRIAGRPTTSRAGAMGLMQVMPDTWAELRAVHGLGNDPHDPRDNILAGTAYLRAMYDRFGYPGLFAAYHAGPARYAAYLAGRRELPAETRSYLASVTGMSGTLVADAPARAQAPLPTPTRDTLFVPLTQAPAGASPPLQERPRSHLFAIEAVRD